MGPKHKLNEILRPEQIEASREHILDFLLMEGITPHPHTLGETELSERQLKELLAELAHDTE